MGVDRGGGMPLALQFVKYTPQACAAVFEEGFTARRRVLADYLGGMDVKLLEMWAVASDDWDFAALVDVEGVPFDMLAANLLRGYGVGVIERSSTVWLSTLEDIDAARSRLPGYTAPGQ
jgi:hypothetical protein